MFTIFWKESRQYTPVAVAILLICLLVSVMNAADRPLPSPAETFFTIALTFTALYSVSITAILFAGEHDEKTFPFLQRLPIRPTQLVFGKLLWLFVSSSALAAATFAIAAFFANTAVGTGNDNFSRPILLFFVSGVLWGFYWTTRCKTQLAALLGTYFSAAIGNFLAQFLASFVFWGLAFLFPEKFYSGFFAASSDNLLYLFPEKLRGGFLVENADSLLTNLVVFGIYGLITLPPAVLGLVRMGCFFAFSPVSQKRDVVGTTVFDENGLNGNPRGAFRTLLWHAITQSLPMYRYMTGLGILTILWLGWQCSVNRLFSFGNLEEPLLLVIVVLSTMVFCGSVFAGDQRAGGAAMLAQRGVSPRKIWWSRILPAVFVLVTPYLLFAVFTHCTGYDWRNGYSNILSADYLAGTMTADALQLCRAVLLCFCVGQMMSLFIRSTILAIVGTGAGFLVLNGWDRVIQVLLGLSPWWTVPVAVSFLVASRLYCDEWLRCRSVWNYREKGNRRIYLAIAVPMLAILCAIPPVRIYSVPLLDFGYRARSGGDYDWDKNWLKGTDRTPRAYFVGQFEGGPISYKTQRGEDDLRRLLNRGGLSQEDVDPQEYLDAWRYEQYYIRSPGSYPMQPIYSVYSLNRDGFYRVFSNSTAPSVSAGFERDNPALTLGASTLRQKIAVLQKMPQYRTPSRYAVTRIYEQELLSLRTGLPENRKQPGIVTSRLRLPWERARLLRQLNNLFQMYSLFADRADAAVFDGVGDLRAISDDFWRWYHQQDTAANSNRSLTILNGRAFYERTIDPNLIYRMELTRRTELVVLAIHWWYVEHGELPPSLDVLVAETSLGLRETDILETGGREPFGYQRESYVRGDAKYKEPKENASPSDAAINYPHLSVRGPYGDNFRVRILPE